MQRPQKRHKQVELPDFPLLSGSDNETPGLPTRVHKKNVGGAYTMQRLESCERFLCSQTLATPLSIEAAEPVFSHSGAEAYGGEFSISYSQHYMRCDSQRFQGDEDHDGAGPSSWESSATALKSRTPLADSPIVVHSSPDATGSHPKARDSSARTFHTGEDLSDKKLDSDRRDRLAKDDAVSLRVASGQEGSDSEIGRKMICSRALQGNAAVTSNGDHPTSLQRESSTTPELCADPSMNKENAGRKLFPMFRPKSQWKTLHIIRHGESEFNAACATKTGFGDPQVYDPKLTARGRKQAEKLREKLLSMKISKDALWVVSPMTRAMETMVIGCPVSARIGNVDNPLKLAVRKELAEQCQTTGDIGLPKSHLLNNFPQFSKDMAEVPERWWFKHMENDALQHRLVRLESKAQMRLRVGEFRKWVQSRPEKVIVAFGHHCMFKELTNGQKGLRNCEIHTMSI